MRWVLPGGATLGGGAERRVVCRPNTAVIERTKPRRPALTPQTETTLPPPGTGPTVSLPPADTHTSTFKDRLAGVKLLLEVLAILVGLIGAILALFGLSRK